jgi:hypothetical protein
MRLVVGLAARALQTVQPARRPTEEVISPRQLFISARSRFREYAIFSFLWYFHSILPCAMDINPPEIWGYFLVMPRCAASSD